MLLSKMGYKGGGLGVKNKGIIHPFEAKERPQYECLDYVEKEEWSSRDISWVYFYFCHKRGHEEANCWDLHLELVPYWFLKQKEDMKCKTSPKRDQKVTKETKTSSSCHSSYPHQAHKTKDNHKRYKHPDYSKAFDDHKQHDDLNNMLWNVFPRTFFHAPNHCVARFHKRKELVKKMTMSIGIETKKGSYHLSLKTFVPRKAHKKFCTHCNISGHWIKKCWNLHPHLHTKKDK